MAESLQGLKSSYDAVVVGARCAGAATAMLLARGGMDVLLVEQGARDADTLSTHALMRAGVLQLARWGLLDRIKAAGTPAIERTTFHYGGEPIAIRITPRDGVDALYAPRRTLLDPLLADAARSAGAHVMYQTRATTLRRDTQGRVRGVVVESGGLCRSIDAAIVIGADGISSVVARETAAVPYRTGQHAAAIIYARVRGLPNDGYHWHYAPGASVGVIPTNGAESLVFSSMPRERFMRDLRFDLAAGFTQIVAEAAPTLRLPSHAVSSFRGFAGHSAYFRPAWGPGWALVGDAGYFKDPITAHGMTDALRDAELLADAVTAATDEALAEYQDTRDRLSSELFTITDRIASFAWTMPELQALHRAFSDEMAREVSYLRQERDVGARKTASSIDDDWNAWMAPIGY